MGNITLSMPDDVQKKMKNFSEIRWSEVARKAIVEKINKLEMIDQLAKNSKLTPEDVEELNSIIKKKASKRFLKSVNNNRQ